MTPSQPRVRRTLLGSGARRVTGWSAALVGIAVLGGGVLTGCSSTPHDPTPDEVTSSLGAVPIPSAPKVDPTPTASPGRPQVLAMGAPTIARLPDGATALIAAVGPDQEITQPTSTSAGDEQTPATITVDVTGQTGTVTLQAADLVCRDEVGNPLPLTVVGPPSVTVGAGQRASVSVKSVFTSGAAALEWHPAGQSLAVWDFTIELD